MKPLEYMNNFNKTVKRTHKTDFIFGGKRKSTFKNETFELALQNLVDAKGD